MDYIVLVHVFDTFANLPHEKYTVSFGEREIVRDYSFEELTSWDAKDEETRIFILILYYLENFCVILGTFFLNAFIQIIKYQIFMYTVNYIIYILDQMTNII